MTPEQFRRIEALFHAALELPLEERAAFLDGEPDAIVRAEVDRLLIHATAVDQDPITDRLNAVINKAPAAPRALGRYRLLEEIGEGGMGTVFLAETDVDGTRKQVAIKLLHGFPTEAARRRMRRERGLLASLSHPNIASHLDGGETDQQQPFLVMEYVPGQPLIEYLAHQPDIRTRLHLFLQLCDAVAHAHERLVLHRDLKPGNVVVRPNGVPALLDFGVGALLVDADTVSTDCTQTIAFTPGYGAPEQRLGLAATTATDVFGLGALLFDILTDARLATLRKGDAPVPPPSLNIEDATRRRAVSGDLDRIVLKATMEAPTERYRTALELADDVRRYFQGLPIRAMPDAWTYRTRKFVGRHRVVVAASVATILGIGFFILQISIERQRSVLAEQEASRQAEHAVAARDFLVSVLGSAMPEARRGDPITVSRLLADTAERLRLDTHLPPQSKAAVWLMIADIYDSQGDPVPALAAVDAADALLKGDADPALLARSLKLRGMSLYGLERHTESKTAFDRYMQRRAKAELSQAERARDQGDYGRAAMQWGDYDLATAHLTRALTMLDEREGDMQERASLLRALITTSLQQHDLRSADRYLDQAQATSKTLDREDVGWISYRRIAAQVRLAQGRPREALAETEEALRLAKVVYGERSLSTAEAENDLGTVLNSISRYGEAIAHLQNAHRIHATLDIGEARLAQSNVNLAAVYEAYGDYGKAAEIAARALQDLPTDPAQTHWRITALACRGYSLAALGRHPQADQDFREALSLSKDRGAGPDSTQTAWVLMRQARGLIHAHRWDDAQRSIDRAAELYGKHTDDTHPSRITLERLRILLALEQGELDDADRRNQTLLLHARKHPAMDPLWLAQLRLTSAQIDHGKRRDADARRLLGQASTILVAGLSPHSPEITQLRRLETALR